MGGSIIYSIGHVLWTNIFDIQYDGIFMTDCLSIPQELRNQKKLNTPCDDTEKL
jgi:hypothetical protein